MPFVEGSPLKIGVMGAGLIGGYLGGRLAAAGHDVTFVARARFRDEVTAHGLRLTGGEGPEQRLTAVRVALDAGALAGCTVVLVTVKTGQTAEAAEQLRPALSPGALVVSFQNGLQAGELLRAALPGRVLRAMVPFNVISRAPGHLHQATNGGLVIEADGRERPLVAALAGAGLEVRADADIRSIQWGKLLLNLNNPINALAGVPLKEELESRGYRQVLAACAAEGLRVLRAAGIRPRVDAPIPLPFLPFILRLPTPIFRRVAARLVRIDPTARSSMWQDLTAGRLTEVDAINGELVRLAAAHGLRAPVNEAICGAVHQAEGHGSPGLSAPALLQRLGLAR